MLNCKAGAGPKLPADAGFLCDKDSAAGSELRDVVKQTLCRLVSRIPCNNLKKHVIRLAGLAISCDMSLKRKAVWIRTQNEADE
jgi:hypothetical protein